RFIKLFAYKTSILLIFLFFFFFRLLFSTFLRHIVLSSSKLLKGEEKMIRLFILTLTVLFITSNLYSVSDEFESRLLAKALLESATTSEQKAAVVNYFKAIAEQKREEAAKLRQLAKLSRGGKISTQQAQKEEFLKKAYLLEREAKTFDSFAFYEFNSQEAVAVKQ
ncbi:MAG: hypothetical protein N3A69_14005, partial [Leptospiraceae bacterium]|nr:hypothetical protein [Leptospiraceae bacterium]